MPKATAVRRSGRALQRLSRWQVLLAALPVRREGGGCHRHPVRRRGRERLHAGGLADAASRLLAEPQVPTGVGCLGSVPWPLTVGRLQRVYLASSDPGRGAPYAAVPCRGVEERAALRGGRQRGGEHRRVGVCARALVCVCVCVSGRADVRYICVRVRGMSTSGRCESGRGERSSLDSLRDFRRRYRNASFFMSSSTAWLTAFSRLRRASGYRPT